MIIYEILNIKNNKRYIGQTIQLLRRRKSQHLHILRKNRKCNDKFQKAWNKYGEESFIFNEILKCSSREELDLKETEYIEKLGDYNISLASRGPKFNEETLKKISEGNKGKIISVEQRKLLSDANHGIKNPKCKLSEKDVYDIRFNNNYSIFGSKSEISRKYNVNRSVIVKITKGNAWQWITKDYFKKDKITTI